MTKFPTLYTVHLAYYEDGKLHKGKITGILFSDGWSDAAAQISEYYGDDVESMSIEAFEDGLIEIPEKYIEDFYKVLAGTAGSAYIEKEVL